MERACQKKAGCLHHAGKPADVVVSADGVRVAADVRAAAPIVSSGASATICSVGIIFHALGPVAVIHTFKTNGATAADTLGVPVAASIGGRRRRWGWSWSRFGGWRSWS